MRNILKVGSQVPSGYPVMCGVHVKSEVKKKIFVMRSTRGFARIYKIFFFHLNYFREAQAYDCA